MTDFDPHPAHNVAANVMDNAINVSPMAMRKEILAHFNSLPNGHRHKIAGYFSKKYVEGANMQDDLAAASHRHYDYKAAADALDQGNEEYGGLHHMLAYNLGASHPLVQKVGDFVAGRHEMTSAYRNTVGLGQDDINKRFGDIVGNLNIGQQFKPKEED